jgi:hypothetical protein
MTDTPNEHVDGRVQFLDELIRANPPIAGGVLKVGDDTWVIHGIIPVDGDVILAEFCSYREARTVLDELPTGWNSNTDP